MIALFFFFSRILSSQSKGNAKISLLLCNLFMLASMERLCARELYLYMNTLLTLFPYESNNNVVPM